MFELDPLCWEFKHSSPWRQWLKNQLISKSAEFSNASKDIS